MPTYDYVCGKCGDTIEVYQTFDEAPLKRHRGGCGGKLTRVLAPVGVVLKGSGFYKKDSNDSARAKSKARSTTGTKSSDDKSNSKSSDDKSGSKSSDSKSSDSKSTSAAKSHEKTSTSSSTASKSA